MKTFWTTKEGERIRFKDMEDSHLINTVEKIERENQYDQYEEEYAGLLDKMEYRGFRLPSF